MRPYDVDPHEYYIHPETEIMKRGDEWLKESAEEVEKVFALDSWYFQMFAEKKMTEKYMRDIKRRELKRKHQK